MQQIKLPTLLIYLILFPALSLFANTSEQSIDGFEPRLSGEVVSLSLQSRGSQFHHPDWLYGDILLYSGELVENKQLRYNGFRDALVWLHPKTGQFIMLDTDLISGFILHDQQIQHRMVFDRITPRGDNQGVFAERLFQGNIVLYAHRKIEQTGEERRVSGGAMRPIAVLEARHVYFVRSESGSYRELNRLNRRSLLAAFPEQRREIRALLRQNRIGVFNEAQLIQAVHVIDEFLQENFNQQTEP